MESSTERAAAFDAEALAHRTALKRLSRRLVHNPTEAEDLVQDTYLHALQASHRFTPGTNLRAWLRTILTNLARNRRRDDGRARVRANEAEVARAAAARGADQPSPEELLVNERLGSRMQEALEGMPKALRDAIWLRDVEELSYAEIAQRMRVPLGTVMSRISRGRRALHERLVGAAPPELEPRRACR